jgi:hypothetical protein
MNQGHEDFAAALLQLPNRLFDLGIAPAVTLFPQSLENPFRRVTLFAGQFLIGLKDSGNPLPIGTDFPLAPQWRSILGWGRIGQNLLDGFEVKSRLSLNLTDTDSVSKYSSSYLTPFFHVPKHSLFPPLIPEGPIPSRSGESTKGASLLDRPYPRYTSRPPFTTPDVATVH